MKRRAAPIAAAQRWRSALRVTLEALDQCRAYPPDREGPCATCADPGCPFAEAEQCQSAIALAPLRLLVDP